MNNPSLEDGTLVHQPFLYLSLSILLVAGDHIDLAIPSSQLKTLRGAVQQVPRRPGDLPTVALERYLGGD